MQHAQLKPCKNQVGGTILVSYCDRSGTLISRRFPTTKEKKTPLVKCLTGGNYTLN